MDNDNKINISKPEVKLFLGDKIVPADLSSTSTYDIEKEFEKAKANRSYKVMLILVGMGIFVVLFSIFFSKYVKVQNEKMKVSVESFDDLNLRRLLDSVSRIENEISLAMAEKKQIDDTYKESISSAEQFRDADLHTLQYMNLSKYEFSKQRQAIIDSCEHKKALIKATYDEDTEYIDAKIKELTDQLAAMDSANLERAQQMQSEIDSQRQVFEIEKQQLVDEYETNIETLKSQLATQKEEAYKERNKAIDTVAARYKKEIASLKATIASLDPVLSDAKAAAIVDEANKLENSAPQFLSPIAEKFELAENDVLLLAAIDGKLANFDYLAGVIEAQPHKNSLASFARARNFILHSFADDTAALLTSILSARTEAEENAVELGAVVHSYEFYLESQLKESGDFGCVVDPRNKNEIVVYVSPVYKETIEDTPAYVYRKANELIGEVVLKKQGNKIVAVPQNSRVGSKIKVGDRVLIDVSPK
ncbi:MAG: hypothetical protein II973_07375 [Spirochaetaceae bacterium]|nr:hypothetical protein [Spirochaetaceae bacterium]MDD6487908.1 hypothetical protein [Spirochaetales bacterium]